LRELRFEQEQKMKATEQSATRAVPDAAPSTGAAREAHVLVPKWFLGFLSAVLTLVSIAVVPWAASISETLTTLKVEMAGLRARFDGRDALQEEVIRGLNQRLTRVETELDRIKLESGSRSEPDR
jgi:hypothetical protein